MGEDGKWTSLLCRLEERLRMERGGDIERIGLFSVGEVLPGHDEVYTGWSDERKLRMTESPLGDIYHIVT